MNKIELKGRAGKDAQERGKIKTFSLAVWRGTNKQTNEDLGTDWFDIALVGKAAQETVCKGDAVTVRGKINSRDYQGKTYWTVTAFECEVEGKQRDSASEWDELAKPVDDGDSFPF